MTSASEVLDEVILAIEEGEITDSDDYSEWLDTQLDSVLVYDKDIFDYLLESSNRNAYCEQMGSIDTSENPLAWATMAFYALREDVNEKIGDIEKLIEEYKPGERCDDCGSRIDDEDLKVTTSEGSIYETMCVPDDARCERCPECKVALADNHYDAEQTPDGTWYCSNCFEELE